jgi:DNA-binding CsgD family transcriptional regulator
MSAAPVEIPDGDLPGQPLKLVATGPMVPPMIELLRSLRAARIPIDYTEDLVGFDPGETLALVGATPTTPGRVAAMAQAGFRTMVVFGDDERVSPALCVAAGATAVVGPHLDPGDLAAILTLARRGMVVVPWGAMSRPGSIQQAQAVASLSSNERAFLHAAANGHTLTQIAAANGCSVRTLHRRLQRIYARLGVPGLSQALSITAACDPSSI